MLLGLGLVAHYFALLERSRGLHTVPYHDLYGSMSLFGWLLALTYLGLEFYHQQRSVGAFALPFILGFFLTAHSGARGPAIADRRAWGRFRVSRHAEYSGVRGVRAVLRAEPDLSRRRALAAQPQAQQRGVAPALAGTAGAHEPFERARRRDLHRHRHGAGIHLGGSAHRPILVLRSRNM